MNRIEKLLALLNEQPDDSFLLFALALEYININDDEKALNYFNQILNSEPGYEGLYYHLGKLYERRNDIKKAKEIYTIGLDVTKGRNQKAYNELFTALSQISE